MKIVVFGASGQTGRLLVEQALQAGHEVTAYVRRDGVFSTGTSGLRVVIGDLDNDALLEEAIKGAEICFSTLGGGSLKDRAAWFTRGVSRIIAIMEKLGVERFIYLSSVGAGESRGYMGPLMRLLIVKILLRIPLADHTANERQLAASRLQWISVRPGSLTSEASAGRCLHGSGTIKINGNPKISRTGVASFMLEQAISPTYANEGVWLWEERKKI